MCIVMKIYLKNISAALAYIWKFACLEQDNQLSALLEVLTNFFFTNMNHVYIELNKFMSDFMNFVLLRGLCFQFYFQ